MIKAGKSDDSVRIDDGIFMVVYARSLLSKEKMSLISKIEQLKTHELQLMEELSNMQSRVLPSPDTSEGIS